MPAGIDFGRKTTFSEWLRGVLHVGEFVVVDADEQCAMAVEQHEPLRPSADVVPERSGDKLYRDETGRRFTDDELRSRWADDIASLDLDEDEDLDDQSSIHSFLGWKSDMFDHGRYFRVEDDGDRP